jgi:hypothetical protein
MPIYSMASSTTAYTDIEANPENKLYYYLVAVQKPELCSPTGTSKKADSGPYSQSMSNLEDNRFLTGINNKYSKSGTVIIYPNPFSDQTIVRFHNPENKEFRITIRDLSGKIMKQFESVTGNEFTIMRENLASGYYIIEIAGDEILREKIIIE